MNKILLTLSVSALILAGCAQPAQDDDSTAAPEVTGQSDATVQPGDTNVEDAIAKSAMMDQKEINQFNELFSDTNLVYAARLEDVTEGSALGTAKAGLIEGEYQLAAEFTGLPDVEPGYFYEGWVVRENELSVISTGAATPLANGKMINTFRSTDDLTDHEQYILTYEPDDGDPAPAEHILEGTFSK